MMPFSRYIKSLDWKSVVIAILATTLLATEGWRLFRSYYFGIPDGTAIVTMGGVLVIPSKYWLDVITYRSGTNFKKFGITNGAPGGNILVGQRGELKPEFWDWVSKSKQREHERCGINIVNTVSQEIRSVLAYDDRYYILFVAVPDAEIDSSLDNLCRSRAQMNKRSRSSLKSAR